MKAVTRGVHYCNMMKFYFNRLAMGECVIRHAGSLNITLQTPNLSAVER